MTFEGFLTFLRVFLFVGFIFEGVSCRDFYRFPGFRLVFSWGSFVGLSQGFLGSS